MKKSLFILIFLSGILLIIFFACNNGADAAPGILQSIKVSRTPSVDGKGDDAVWTNAPSLKTNDSIKKSDITIKSVYTDQEIFFLVTSTDTTENRKHKHLVWDEEQNIYTDGPAREDMFVFKFVLDQNVDDFTLSSDRPYMADIWFWKADRTDPVGYADDKIQKYSATELPDSLKLRSKSGIYFYLARLGDKGTSAYKNILYEGYKEDVVPKYENRTPQGSRADVRAKGIWADGVWTIEFKRKLNTGNSDDIAFNVKKKYLFGVSAFEIAGRGRETSEQPDYGSGEITEVLTLVLK